MTTGPPGLQKPAANALVVTATDRLAGNAYPRVGCRSAFEDASGDQALARALDSGISSHVTSARTSQVSPSGRWPDVAAR